MALDELKGTAQKWPSIQLPSLIPIQSRKNENTQANAHEFCEHLEANPAAEGTEPQGDHKSQIQVSINHPSVSHDSSSLKLTKLHKGEQKTRTVNTHLEGNAHSASKHLRTGGHPPTRRARPEGLGKTGCPPAS